MLKRIFLSFIIMLGFMTSMGATSTAEAASIDINASNDSSIILSEPMTAEQIAKEYANNQNVSYEQAKEALFPQSSISAYTEISPYAINYRTLQKSLPDNAGFVYFYCQTDESSTSFRAINKILNAGYSSGSKIYSGTLYYHLPDPNRINYILNGHLYNTGITTVSGGGSIGLGSSATANINISSTSSYYKPLYNNSYLTF